MSADGEPAELGLLGRMQNGGNGEGKITPTDSELELARLMEQYHKQDPRTRKWLRIDSQGKSDVLEMDKHELVKRLGIPYRDLRQMDPFIPQPYPSAILIRECAIVLSLESIRMITTKDECFVLTVPNSDETVRDRDGVFPHKTSPLVRDLMALLEYDATEANSPEEAHVAAKLGVKEMLNRKFLDADLPYELRVTEAALTEYVRMMNGELSDLEGSIYPALEEMTHAISTKSLDTLRGFKTDVKAMSQRIGKVRAAVEDLLDDDQDMADMYLSRRAAEVAAASHHDEVSRKSLERGGIIGRTSSRDSSSRLDREESRRLEPAGKRHKVHPHDISECEDMLEVYFMQLDFLFGRLEALNERVEDTEDLIEVDLDHRRNELVRMNLVVNGITLMFAVVSAVTGAFGMNLNTWMPQGTKSSAKGWAMAVAFSSFAGFLILAAVVGFAKYRKLLSVPGGGG